MNDSTVLYRQICKAHIQNGRITSLAFKPMPKDNFLLSVYDGDKISAKDSFDHFKKILMVHPAQSLELLLLIVWH